MYPQKHFRDLESSRRRSKLLWNALLISIVLVSITLLGPMIHEASHLAALEAIDCERIIDPGISLTGLYASIKPLCTPSDSFLLLFYGSGYFSTIVLGALLNFSALRASRKSGDILVAAGTGILLSFLTGMGRRGDVTSFLRILGLERFYTLASLFLMLGIFSLTLGGLRMFLAKREEMQHL